MSSLLLSIRTLLPGNYLPRRLLDGTTLQEAKPAGWSDLEWMVKKELDRRGLVYSVQQPFAGGIGYIGGMRVDFVLTHRRVIIRVMGFWHETPGARERDAQQRAYLEAEGYHVIDLTTTDVMTDLRGALNRQLGVPVLF